MNPRSTPQIPAVMRGAVDLSALRDRAQAASRPASAPTSAPDASTASPRTPGNPGTPPAPTGAGVTIIDVTEATFQSEVLERSLNTPRMP